MNKNIKRLFFAMAFMSALSAFSYVDSYAIEGDASEDSSSENKEKAISNVKKIVDSVNKEVDKSLNDQNRAEVRDKVESINKKLDEIENTLLDDDKNPITEGKSYDEGLASVKDEDVKLPYKVNTVDIVVDNDEDEKNALKYIDDSYERQQKELDSKINAIKDRNARIDAFVDVYIKENKPEEDKTEENKPEEDKSEDNKKWKDFLKNKLFNDPEAIVTTFQPREASDPNVEVNISSKEGKINYLGIGDKNSYNDLVPVSNLSRDGLTKALKKILSDNHKKIEYNNAMNIIKELSESNDLIKRLSEAWMDRKDLTYYNKEAGTGIEYSEDVFTKKGVKNTYNETTVSFDEPTEEKFESYLKKGEVDNDEKNAFYMLLGNAMVINRYTNGDYKASINGYNSPEKYYKDKFKAESYLEDILKVYKAWILQNEEFRVLSKNDEVTYTNFLKNPETGNWVDFKITIVGVNKDKSKYSTSNYLESKENNDKTLMLTMDERYGANNFGKPLDFNSVPNRILFWPGAYSDLQLRVDFLENGKPVNLNAKMLFTDIDGNQILMLRRLYYSGKSGNKEIKVVKEYKDMDILTTIKTAEDDNYNKYFKEYLYGYNEENIAYLYGISIDEQNPSGWIIFAPKDKISGFEYVYTPGTKRNGVKDGNDMWGSLHGIGDMTGDLAFLKNYTFELTKYNLYRRDVEGNNRLVSDILMNGNTQTDGVYKLQNAKDGFKYTLNIDYSDLKKDIDNAIADIKGRISNRADFINNLKNKGIEFNEAKNNLSSVDLEKVKIEINQGSMSSSDKESDAESIEGDGSIDIKDSERSIDVDNSNIDEKSQEIFNGIKYHISFDLPKEIVFDKRKDGNPSVISLLNELLPSKEESTNIDPENKKTVDKEQSAKKSPWEIRNEKIEEDIKQSENGDATTENKKEPEFICHRVSADIVLNEDGYKNIQNLKDLVDYLYSVMGYSETSDDKAEKGINLYIAAKPREDFKINTNYTAKAKVVSTSRLSMKFSYKYDDLLEETVESEASTPEESTNSVVDIPENTPEIISRETPSPILIRSIGSLEISQPDSNIYSAPDNAETVESDGTGTKANRLSDSDVTYSSEYMLGSENNSIQKVDKWDYILRAEKYSNEDRENNIQFTLKYNKGSNTYIDNIHGGNTGTDTQNQLVDPNNPNTPTNPDETDNPNVPDNESDPIDQDEGQDTDSNTEIGPEYSVDGGNISTEATPIIGGKSYSIADRSKKTEGLPTTNDSGIGYAVASAIASMGVMIKGFRRKK